MTIRTQLIILVLVPLLCAAGAAGGMFYAQRAAALAGEAVAQTAPLSAELHDFVLFLQEPPPGSGRTAQYHLQAARNRISSLTTGLKPFFPSTDEQQLLQKLTTAPQHLSKQLDQMTRGSSALSSRGALLLTQEIKSFLPVIDQLNSYYARTLQTRTNQINTLNQLLLLAAAIWPLLLSVLLYRTLARPLTQLKDAVAAVTRGDLSYRISGQPAGELGLLAGSFNKMTETRQRAESSAKDSEARLKDVFDNLPMLTVCLETNGAISYCNDYLLQVTGYRRHELIGKNWFDLFIAEPEPARQIFNRMVTKAEIVQHDQNSILTKSGVLRTVAWSNTLNHDTNGAISGVTSIGSDITVQHAAEQALEQNQRILRSLVDGNPESLYLVDRNATVLIANSTFARRLNKGVSQVTGSSLDELFSPDVAQRRRARIEEVFSSGRPLIFNDAQDLWQFEHHLNPVSTLDGSVESVSILTIDVTDQRRNEENLQQANQLLKQNNEELEQRVAERTSELTRLNEELARARDTAEGASRSKSEFLANMSHEIRTPMNAILGLVHLALQTDLNHKQREYLDTVSNSAQSLLGIINDILDVSKIEAGRLQIEKTNFSLEGVVTRALALLSIKAREQGINLEQQVDTSIPDALVGDPLRLEQVLVNLLGNAVKFTDSGTVTLQIRRGAERPDSDEITVEISITDTGVGMDEQTLGRLFKPFSQGDTSTTRTHGGTGLGLTICRHLVEMMGGSIKVTSRPGQGSCFTFSAVFGIGTTSARRKAGSSRSALVQRYRSLQGLQLLVTEDHPINRQIAREILEAVGVQVETANNGREAVAAIHDHGDRIDLILMDIQMPIMDGYEATREIRRRYSRNRLPIIAMTAHALTEERERCLSSGMNEHLAKPIAVEKLYELLARLTGRIPGAPAADETGTELPEGPPDQLPEQLPGITVEAALKRVNGNTRLLKQLIRMFAQEHQAMPAEVRQLMADNDLPSAARLVHGLKGVAGNLAAERLHIAAANLEAALKKQDPKAAAALLPLLEAALQEICSTAALLDEPDMVSGGSNAGSPAEIAALLGELQHLLEIHSLDISTPLNRLRDLLPSESDRPQLAALADAAQRLDYQQALMLLHTLAEKTGTCEETP